MGASDWLLNLPYERVPFFGSRANPLMGVLGPQQAPRLAAQESALTEQPWMYGYQSLPAPAPTAPTPSPEVPREYMTLPGEAPPTGPTTNPQVLADQLKSYWYEPFAAAAGEGLPYPETAETPKRKKKKPKREGE